jgi:hypothetical protein
VLTPATFPELLSQNGEAKVPPSVPRSRIRPRSQRKASVVGIPVVGFGVESV